LCDFITIKLRTSDISQEEYYEQIEQHGINLRECLRILEVDECIIFKKRNEIIDLIGNRSLEEKICEMYKNIDLIRSWYGKQIDDFFRECELLASFGALEI